MSFFNPRLVAALAVAVASLGCGVHYVTRGADLYAGGHYIEAAEVFERTEARLESSSAEQRARYGLYRGATLLALGDTRHAERWLNYSAELFRTDDSALSPADHAMLRRAFHAIERRPASEPPRSEGSAVATSQKLPLRAADRVNAVDAPPTKAEPPAFTP